MKSYFFTQSWKSDCFQKSEILIEKSGQSQKNDETQNGPYGPQEHFVRGWFGDFWLKKWDLEET